MARLKPYEILEAYSVYGHKPGPIIRMLEHYGFEQVNVKGGNKDHRKFKHREYSSDIPFVSIPFGSSYVLDPAYVKETAEACMEVKRLNALRRFGENLAPIPDWVAATIPQEFSQRIEANVLRVIADPNGEIGRGYSIKCKDKKLTLTSLEYPERSMTFSVTEGDRKTKENFTRMFAEFDLEICASTEELRAKYNTGIEELGSTHGVTIKRDNPAMTEEPMIHLTHPQYHLEYALRQYGDKDSIPADAGEIIKKIISEHERCWFNQQEFLEGLKKRGWTVTSTRNEDDQPGVLTLEKDGKLVTVPTSGKDEMVDIVAIQKKIEELEVPAKPAAQPAEDIQWQGPQTSKVPGRK